MPGNWRKSSLSFSNGACVEAASWRTASRPCDGGACVEAAHGPGVVGVRDSFLGEASPVVEFPVAAWRGFTSRLRAKGTVTR